MKRLPAVIVVLSSLLLGAGAAAAEYEQLTRNFRDYYLSRNAPSASRRFAVEQNALELARALKPDGSWPDVDYADQTRGGWRPYLHLSRLTSMVRAYRMPGGNETASAELKAGVHKALGHWLEQDYQCLNWWYNQIGVPMAIGEIGILLEDELTPDEYELIVNKIMPRAKIGMTGQNRVWVASNTLVRGLLMKDESLVREAAAAIGEEIRVTTSEGVQPDFSFHQHGPQQQFGNYGLSFAGSASMWLRIFSGTPFEFPQAKLDIVHDYLIAGQNWVVWRGRMDLSSCGRQLDEDCQAGKGRSLAAIMQRMSEVDPARADEYLAFVNRNRDAGANDLVGNRHFWRSDYMIQRGADYYASVKMCSRRVIGGELVNSENMSGYHLADGALLVHRTGREYENIQPVWDWQKIPGTTAPQRPDGPPRLRKRYSIDSDFVGGASDGRIGCAALDFNRDGLRARKAYFFIDDMIACLGAAIQTEASAHPVVTTVNQCLLTGDVWAGDGQGGRKLARGEHRLEGPIWVWHDGIGYVFPAGSAAAVRIGEQRGSWRKVEDKPAVSAKEVGRDVFLLTIDHGVGPASAEYAFVLVPHGATPESMPQCLDTSSNVRVLANTPGLQAVASAGGAVFEAAFYEPGELDLGRAQKFAVAQPCVAVLDGTREATRLTIADPTQRLRQIVLPLDGRTVTLPQDGEAGKSVQIDLPNRSFKTE